MVYGAEKEEVHPSLVMLTLNGAMAKESSAGMDKVVVLPIISSFLLIHSTVTLESYNSNNYCCNLYHLQSLIGNYHYN